MGRFSRNREYTFVSLEEMVSEVMEHYNEGMNIDILLASGEVERFIIALLSTNVFVPYSIDYARTEVNNYSDEYQISLVKQGDVNAMYIEPAFSVTTGCYFDNPPESSDLVFISKDGSIDLYNKYRNDNYNVILFDIQK